MSSYRLAHHRDKLDQLGVCYERADKLCQRNVEDGHEVVGVHDEVDKPVQHNRVVDIAVVSFNAQCRHVISGSIVT